MLTVPQMQNTHTNTVTGPQFSQIYTASYTLSHPHRAHANPAVSSVISSWCKRDGVTLNSWAVEREGETCEGEREKERTAEGELKGGKAVLKGQFIQK